MENRSKSEWKKTITLKQFSIQFLEEMIKKWYF